MQPVYTQKQIKNWENDLLTLPREIAHLEHQIQNWHSQINALNQELDDLKTRSILPLDHKISQLQARLDVLKLPEKM